MNKTDILLITVLIAFFSAGTVSAAETTDSLGIGVYKGRKVVMHKVTPKETFYSIDRHYNVHPRYLIRFNTHIDGLQIGDTVRMEIDSMNTFQNLVLVPENDQPAQETTFPTPAAPPQSTVTEHVVAPRETLFAIAQKYGLTVAELRKLNDIGDSHIEIGQRLIVSASGPIANDPEQLSAASNASNTPDETGEESPKAGPDSPANDESAETEEKVYTSTPTPIMSTPDRMAAQSKDTKKKNKDLPQLVRDGKESRLADWLTHRQE